MLYNFSFFFKTTNIEVNFSSIIVAENPIYSKKLYGERKRN